MRVHLICFGVLETVFGAAELDWEFDGLRVGELLDDLAARQPGFAAWRARVACAQGDRLVRAERELTAGADIALLPPVGGG